MLSSKIHMADAAQSFLQSLEHERRLSAYTVRNYGQTLVAFELFLAGHLDEDADLKTLMTLEQRDFRSFLAARQSDGIGAATMRLDLSAIRTFFKYIDRQTGLKNPKLAMVRAPKLPVVLPKPVTDKDAKKLIKASDENDDWQGARDKALFTLLYGAGLRLSEGLGLTWAETPLPQSLTLTGKGNKQRMVPLLPAIGEAVRAYQEKLLADKEASLFPAKWTVQNPDAPVPLFFSKTGKVLSPRIAQRIMASLRQNLDLPLSATPHALRHAFATQLLAKGGDLRAIQELLGHSSLAATQRYTKIDAAGLLKTYQKAHPRAF